MPRWIARAVGLLAAATIPVTLLEDVTIDFGPWLFLLFYAGLIAAVALAVGAVQASVRPPSPAEHERPSSLRIVLAGLAGLACLGAAGVAAPLLLASMVSGDYGPGEIGEGYIFAILVLAIFVGGQLRRVARRTGDCPRATETVVRIPANPGRRLESEEAGFSRFARGLPRWLLFRTWTPSPPPDDRRVAGSAREERPP